MEFPYFYDGQRSPSNALDKVLCCFQFGCSGSSSYIAFMLLSVSDRVSPGKHLPLKTDCEVYGGLYLQPVNDVHGCYKVKDVLAYLLH